MKSSFKGLNKNEFASYNFKNGFDNKGDYTGVKKVQPNNSKGLNLDAVKMYQAMTNRENTNRLLGF